MKDKWNSVKKDKKATHRQEGNQNMTQKEKNYKIKEEISEVKSQTKAVFAFSV